MRPASFHDVPSMNFHGGLAGSDLVGNLLIQHAGNHERHNLPLSRSQFAMALLQIVDLGRLFSHGAVALKRLLNGVQQVLVPERFRQKFHGTRFQSLTDMGMWPCAVIKMTGICMPVPAKKKSVDLSDKRICVGRHYSCRQFLSDECSCSQIQSNRRYIQFSSEHYDSAPLREAERQIGLKAAL
jgi:hypothetical protein